MRYFFHLAYLGNQYHGWQRQPNVIGIQAIVEEALSKICKRTITAIGCGRTDAGVHASQYFLHIDLAKAWTFDPVFRLNKILPKDIAVFDCIEVAPTAHAQFDARLRSYDYFIHGEKDPFLAHTSSLYELDGLNWENLQAAVALLEKHTDYYAFCKRPDLYPHTRCHVELAQLQRSRDGKRLRFRIRANRFLHGMIRLIVGNLLEVGKGKITVADFALALKERQPFRFFNAAYPQGLYLAKVEYPYLSKAVKSSFYHLVNAGFD
ncbi:MAG: tRNA pseudouridine synthase A [Bacteroidota bacterium]